MGNQVSCCFSKSCRTQGPSDHHRDGGGGGGAVPPASSCSTSNGANCAYLPHTSKNSSSYRDRHTYNDPATGDNVHYAHRGGDTGHSNGGDGVRLSGRREVTSGVHNQVNAADVRLDSLGSKEITLMQEPNQSCSNLQHISEREPNDDIGDPSISPSTDTLFLSKFKYNPKVLNFNRNRRKSEYFSSKPQSEKHSHLMSKKYSSCSTIFMDESTVSLPNLKYIVTTVSLAIYYNIKNRNKTDQDTNYTLEIFDEKLHPFSKEPIPDDYNIQDPEHRHIYRFIRMLFSSAQLTAECAIVTLVYLERLLTYTDLIILPANWKRVTLASILLASKVWDDQAVWNVDYCQILKDITVDDMNELERQFLEMLQFNINVPSSVYAKYYFDLRTLAHLSDIIVPMEPLYTDKAAKLEAMSSKYEHIPTKKGNSSLRRVWSLSKINPTSLKTKAILS